MDDVERLTRDLTLKRHRMHWENIATDLETCDDTPETAGDVKRRNLGDKGFAYHIAANCWCCEYVEQQIGDSEGEADCRHYCPIDWTDHGHLPNMCLDGLYRIFSCAIRKEEIRKAAAIARYIARLPAKED